MCVFSVRVPHRGPAGGKVPLLAALQNVLTNYVECLRDRAYADIVAIVKLTRFALPEFVFDEGAVMGMAGVIRDFAQLLSALKRGTGT